MECIDCGKPYSEMGVDLVLPDQQWRVICPEDGILCANCICQRAWKMEEPTTLMGWLDSVDYTQPYEKPESK